MQKFVLFTVLLVVAVFVSAAVVDSEFDDEPVVLKGYVEEDIPEIVEQAAFRDIELNEEINDRNILAFNQTFRQNPVANQIQSQIVKYRGRRIRNIQANDLSFQSASWRVVDGGINKYFADIRLTSVRGRGYRFRVLVWEY